MPAGPCHFCGAAVAPFQFRPPGLRSELPDRFRDRYIRACPAQACRDQAAARIAALPDFGGITAPPPSTPVQSTLL